MRAASLPSGCARRTAKHLIGGFGGDEEDRLAFIGHIDRVQAEQLAGRLHLGPHRQAGLVNLDAHTRRLRNLIQRGSEARRV